MKETVKIYIDGEEVEYMRRSENEYWIKFPKDIMTHLVIHKEWVKQ